MSAVFGASRPNFIVASLPLCPILFSFVISDLLLPSQMKVAFLALRIGSICDSRT
ncbi:hypothetical protein ACFPT7_22180 [Acidicapsa dinghuensis]|uniref:Uncharacterized protein n=1 Tax=Acidicapsa dinghuensis TaxID=2218256 RepID=A0ABW1EQ13_9BACT|nr:hypothetical protein [Acidicapsa dinghuensis]